MIKTLCRLILILWPCASAFAAVQQPAEIKAESLRHLRDLRTANVNRLTEIDRALNQKLDAKVSAGLFAEVDRLKAEKREYLLRQKFLDRLIFQIDTKFTGGEFRTFIERSLLDMAKIDATSDNSSDEGLWKFLKYSAEAIQRLPDPKEDMVAFLEGYMKGSMSNPIPPEDYLSSRNYTNGAKSETGHPMNRDEVGAFADHRLQQMAAAAPAPVPAPAPVAAPTPPTAIKP